jgi:hypothetical protein
MFFSVAGLNAMGYPDPAIEYHLPPLDDLFAHNMANISLDRLTGGHGGPPDYPYSQMWLNLVRLTDLSITRYEAVRESLALYREKAHEGTVSPFYDAINGLEETVVAAHRAALNSQGLEAVAPRKLNRPTPRQLDLLRQVRNHIQHMDDKLQKGQVKAVPIYLAAPTQKSLVIGSVLLSYRDLASCITKMYRNIAIIRQAPSK